MPEAEILAMVASGMTRRDIAAHLGVSRQKVDRFCRKHSIETLGKPGGARVKKERANHRRLIVAHAGTAANPFGL
jgi:DNA-binding transcriptional regulator LsrR (DeoR family)